MKCRFTSIIFLIIKEIEKKLVIIIELVKYFFFQ